MLTKTSVRNGNNQELYELTLNLIKGTSKSHPVKYFANIEDDMAYFLDDDEVFTQLDKMTNGKYANILYSQLKDDRDGIVERTLINHTLEEF